LDDDFDFTVIWEATCTCVPSMVEIGQAVLEMKRRLIKKKAEAKHLCSLRYSGGEHKKNRLD
jgi:hypothetical protein